MISLSELLAHRKSPRKEILKSSYNNKSLDSPLELQNMFFQWYYIIKSHAINVGKQMNNK
jgi:hypothetical protein